MTIFNSLGSNYSFGFALRAIATDDSDKYRSRLMEYLKERYGGEVFLIYKGREAIRLALRAVEKKGKGKMSVAICGFTCYAVYEACVGEGMDVEYLDIDRETLNFSFETLRKKCEENPEINVVVVQNTLGMACEIEKISDFCKRRGIVLIEDLAHSIGAVYEDGRKAGTVGDFVVLSFSQDKMVDGISGGAVVVRNKEFRINNQQFASLPLGQQVRDRFYPLFTWVIRNMYGIGVGKVVHAVLKRFDLLSKPMGGGEDLIYGLPNWYCELIYLQFLKLKDDLAHREKIALVYKEILRQAQDDRKESFERVSKSTNLRFPIFVKQRDELIAFLKRQGVFVSDIWYDSPIAPKRFLKLTDYDGECSMSEEVSELILNLPTHRNVSEEDARRIAEYINEWIGKGRVL